MIHVFAEQGGAVPKPAFPRAVSRGGASHGTEIRCDLRGSGPSTGHPWVGGLREERDGNRRVLLGGGGQARRGPGGWQRGLWMLKGSHRGFLRGVTGSLLGKLAPCGHGRWVKRLTGEKLAGFGLSVRRRCLPQAKADLVVRAWVEKEFSLSVKSQQDLPVTLASDPGQ